MISNIKNEYKTILTIITILMDIFFIYTLCNQNLNTYDKVFTISILFIHSIFLYCLWNYNKKLLDILHVSVFIYLLCSIFLKNKVIIGISLCLILFIQLMWIIIDKCILNEENETWGYGNELAIGSFLLTIALIYKIIY